MSAILNKKMTGNNRRPKRWESRWLTLLMVLAILTITGFQGYWLKNNYDREKENLEITTGSSFRQTVLKLQSSKLKLDRLAMKLDSVQVKVPKKPMIPRRIFTRPGPPRKQDPTVTLLDLIQQKLRDSLKIGDSVRTMPLIAMKGDHNAFFVD